jgi:hypothetical protein
MSDPARANRIAEGAIRTSVEPAGSAMRDDFGSIAFDTDCGSDFADAGDPGDNPGFSADAYDNYGAPGDWYDPGDGGSDGPYMP